MGRVEITQQRKRSIPGHAKWRAVTFLGLRETRVGAVIEPREIRGEEKVPDVLGPPAEGHSPSAATREPGEK